MSSKFTLVTYKVQDGENDYKKYFPFFTSDAQKMTDKQLIAHFFEGDKNTNLECFDYDDDTYWLSCKERCCYIEARQTMTLKEVKWLQKTGFINLIPHEKNIIFKKENNVVQFKKRESA